MTIADDAHDRDLIANALDETLVVEAAAGTGKTTQLVNRIVRVLATGRAKVIEIVAVTFTEKAAGELKLRLREALEHQRSVAEMAEDERVRLDDALKMLEEAHINTIHGFCADLLRERPVEARVDPLFAVLTEVQSHRLYRRAFRRWLEQELKDPREGVRRALRRSSAPRFGRGSGDDGPIDRLEGAGRTLSEWRAFQAPWRRPPFNRDNEVDRLIAALHHLSDLSSTASSKQDNLYIDLAGVRRVSRQIQLEQSFGQHDYDAWEARLIDLLRDRGFARARRGYGTTYGKNVRRADVLAARETLFNDLQQFKKDADADLAACLQSELAGANIEYEELKNRSGALDFTDLLVRTRDLLRSDERVRRHLQSKFKRLFIDEFQDTDPIQAEILLLLASDDPAIADWRATRPTPGKIFIVGDPKQAIYRFRGTDVGTYWEVSRHLERHGGRVVQLSRSYRSVPAIQRFVNAAFSTQMVENPASLQSGYVPLAESRPADDSQPAVVALPVPKPYGTRNLSARAIEASLPDAVGAFIAWLVEESGWHVVEGNERVPVRPKHVAILFRRFTAFDTDMTKPYIEAIEARGLPHLLVGGNTFHQREEVETIRAALAAIEWPDDELSVFATLRGSLFAFDDAALFEFKHRFGPCHPYRIPRVLGGNSGHDLGLTDQPVVHLQPIADVLRLLQRLHRQRNRRPVAETISQLIAETRAHVGFVLRPAGEQALANVLHIAELARQYELNGGISFRGFIDELQSAAEAEAAEAPILEESSDGVRLMTVHKAKGLEFPVVILADLTCRLSRDDAARYLDASRQLSALRIGGWAPHDLHDHEALEVERDRAEGVRLAYVAATRARDLLVVPAIGDEPWEGGWISPLNDALYPPKNRRRTARRANGTPAFNSKDSVLQRPNDDIASELTVCPGEHEMPGDEPYSVVWWDPSALSLGAKVSFGLKREDLIVKDVPRNVVADGRSRYDRWALARADARAAGAVPSLAVETVRDRAAAGLATGPGLRVTPGDVSIVAIKTRHGAVGGPAFGTLVHAVLAQAPFEASEAELREIAKIEARLLGLGDAEMQAASEIVAHAMHHGLFQRARVAAARNACRRESAITWVSPEGTLVEGFVDLAFEENGTWTVVDYKTDREVAAAGEDQYRRQVALYASAVAHATGAPAAGVLVRL